MGAAVDEAKRRAGAERVALFGYSGGGAIAALLAARRGDVTRLVTVAGTLDHARWTHDGGVSPLAASLNPADEAARLQSVPQVHFVGMDDRVVPPAVVNSYLARMTDRSRAELVRVAGFGHECCWERDWAALLARYVYRGGAAAAGRAPGLSP
jgi:pimeloyl-ACP methyl ester carboxylesterase